MVMKQVGKWSIYSHDVLLLLYVDYASQFLCRWLFILYFYLLGLYCSSNFNKYRDDKCKKILYGSSL